MKLNINCIYMMNLQMLSLYVPIDPSIDYPTEKLLVCSCVQYPIPYHLVWRLDPLLAIESPLTSLRLDCQLVGNQYENMLAINIACRCQFLIYETK